MINKPEEKPDFAMLCAQKGLRHTPQRQSIYEALAEDCSHPSAADVHRRMKKAMPSLSFDTVNRTMLLFAEQGLIGEIGDHSRAKRYDAFCDRHHHFHCQSCGRIIDIRDERLDKVALPENIGAIGIAKNIRVNIDGICATCANKQ